MLALAKDITEKDLSHPEEGNIPELKEYMDYQRKLNHDLILYHSLDHAKTNLQSQIEESRGDEAKIKDGLQTSFINAHRFADSNTLMLMLRKLINAQNSTNNWYRLNSYYFALLYDCVENFVKVYNTLRRDAPEKAREYNLSDDVDVDFDDWVQLYFNNLDFMIGQPLQYSHYIFRKRNRAIEEALDSEIKGGQTREDAIKNLQEEFDLEESTVDLLLGRAIDQKNLELFYTSVENPIYHFLHEPNSEIGFMDEESVLQHAYFLGHQLKGRDATEAEQVFSEIRKMSQQ